MRRRRRSPARRARRASQSLRRRRRPTAREERALPREARVDRYNQLSYRPKRRERRMLGPHGLRRLRRVAGAAIDRTITSWFEWYGRIDSARGTDCLEHLAWSAARRSTLRPLCLSRVPAIPATLRLVLESLFRVKLLLANREGEIDSTVLARDDLVLHQTLPEPPSMRRPGRFYTVGKQYKGGAKRLATGRPCPGLRPGYREAPWRKAASVAAASAASKPLSPLCGSARSSACGRVSVVSTPKPMGRPAASWTSMTPRAHSPAT